MSATGVPAALVLADLRALHVELGRLTDAVKRMAEADQPPHLRVAFEQSHESLIEAAHRIVWAETKLLLIAKDAG